MGTKAERKLSEEALYVPTREFLHSEFLKTFGNCHLEITASGHFEEPLKQAVREDIVLPFLERGGSPDLAGFITKDSRIQDFITVEIKSKKITIQDIAQAKLYGDLFSARYAFLISPWPITEEIKRLHRYVFILSRFTSSFVTYIGQLQFARPETLFQPLLPVGIIKDNWFPASPFVMQGVPVERIRHEA